MTVGDSIKRAAQGTKNVTDKVVDAVESKISDVTDTIHDAAYDASDRIHKATGREPKEK